MATGTTTETTSKRPGLSNSKQRPPTNEEIALRAYDIFLKRGGSDGCDLQDWLQAEKELLRSN